MFFKQISLPRLFSKEGKYPNCNIYINEIFIHFENELEKFRDKIKRDVTTRVNYFIKYSNLHAFVFVFKLNSTS